MRPIEVPVQNNTYFINPAQITYAVGNDREECGSSWIAIAVTGQEKSGESVKLRFEGDTARQLISDLRGLGLH